MKCPHLIQWIGCYCKAGEDIYFPSSFQLAEYCTGKDHQKCPFIREQDLAYQVV
jgi:hypothetical protein